MNAKSKTLEGSFKESLVMGDNNVPNNIMSMPLLNPPNGLQEVMNKQYNINEMFSQLNLCRKIIDITETYTKGELIASFQLDNTGLDGRIAVTNVDSDPDWAWIARFFLRMKANMKINVSLQGQAQFQGALIVNTTGRIYFDDAHVWSEGLAVRAPGGDYSNMWRMHRTIIPFMEPSNNSFLLPWTSNYNSFPTRATDSTITDYLPDQIGQYSMDIRAMSPLRKATGVPGYPRLTIWMSFDDVRHGIYQPVPSNVTAWDAT